MGSQVIEAVTFGSRDALLDALRRGGDPNDSQDGQSALVLACIQDRDDLVADLLTHGADVRVSETDGTTPLHVAASIANAGIARLLIGGGANVNAIDSIGQTPLMVAARAGSEHVTEELLRAHANAKARDKVGRNALHWAVAGGDFPVVIEVLLSAGADPGDRTVTGETVLDYAVALNRGSTIAALTP